MLKSEFSFDGISFRRFVSEKRSENFLFQSADENMILLINKGNGALLTEGTSYSFDDGTVFIFKTGETFKLMPEKNENFDCISVLFDEKIFKTFDEKGFLLKKIVDKKDGIGNAFMIDHFEEKLKRANSLEKSTDENTARCILFNLIFNVLLDLTDEDITFIHGKKIKNHEILDYVGKNLKKEISLDIVSSVFYISKSQFNRIFKNMTGTTFWEYVIVKRLFIARELIKNGYPVSSAYKSAGFKDYSSFYRAYIKKFYRSPAKL